MAWCAALWLVFGNPAWGEQRFPPPDFEGGHQLPVTTVPPARGIPLEYVDAIVLLGCLGLASYFVLKTRSRKAVLTLSIFSLIYFGFYRKGCICAIGSPQNVALSLFNESYALPLTAAVFFLAPLLVSLFAGRTFCAAVCPHGALQDLVLLRPVKVPAWLENGLGLLPYIYLGAGVLFAATGSAFLFCRYDPFVPLFRLSGSFLTLMIGALFVVLGVFVGRPYCRFLCPYGALLRLGAAVSKWRVTITPDFCTQCRLCEESCPYGAIREPTVHPGSPRSLATDRLRLGWCLLALPVLLVGGGAIGWRLSTPFSTLHPTVALAEKYADPGKPAIRPSVPTPESLALGRAEQNPKEILLQAAEIRRRFVLGGWLFGGWVGLVVGVKLIGLALRPRRTDYEPDRGACLGCARCFSYCPNEHVRLGLLPALPGANALPPPNPGPRPT